MTIHQTHSGHLEYPTLADAQTAETWLRSFQASHSDWIPDDPMEITVTELDGTGPDNALGAIDFILHYLVPTQVEVDDLCTELEQALVAGVNEPNLVALTNSWDGTHNEG